jgi:hypothetical protein
MAFVESFSKILEMLKIFLKRVQNERKLKRESFKLSKYFFDHLETENAALVTRIQKKKIRIEVKSVFSKKYFQVKEDLRLKFTIV